jgi:hypothetical protein
MSKEIIETVRRIRDHERALDKALKAVGGVGIEPFHNKTVDELLVTLGANSIGAVYSVIGHRTTAEGEPYGKYEDQFATGQKIGYVFMWHGVRVPLAEVTDEMMETFELAHTSENYVEFKEAVWRAKAAAAKPATIDGNPNGGGDKDPKAYCTHVWQHTGESGLRGQKQYFKCVGCDRKLTVDIDQVDV